MPQNLDGKEEIKTKRFFMPYYNRVGLIPMRLLLSSGKFKKLG
jgi:hypothetical protein